MREELEEDDLISESDNNNSLDDIMLNHQTEKDLRTQHFIDNYQYNRVENLQQVHIEGLKKKKTKKKRINNKRLPT